MSQSLPTVIPTQHLPSPYAHLTVNKLTDADIGFTRPNSSSVQWMLEYEDYNHLLQRVILSFIDHDHEARFTEELSVAKPINALFPDEGADRLWHATLLAIWPWVSPQLRHALRPHLTPHLTEEYLVLFSCLDPDTPQIENLSNHSDSLLFILWKARRDQRVLSHDEILALLESYRHRRSALPLSAITLLRCATADQLAILFNARTTKAFRRLALLCPLAPTHAVATATLEADLPYQDEPGWITPASFRVSDPPIWLAPIDLSLLPPRKTVRETLLSLGAWAQHPLILSPQMTLRTTHALEDLLMREAAGAYADLVTLLTYRIPSLSRNIPACSLPRSKDEFDVALQNPYSPTSTLAASLRSMGRLILPSLNVFKLTGHPATTPDWFDRLSQHQHWHVRQSCALSKTIPLTIQERLKQDSHPGVVLAAILTHGASISEIDTFLTTGTVQTISKLIEAMPLSASYVTRLSRHSSLLVRAAVAGFQVLPLEVRHALLNDKSLHVRNAMVCRADVTVQEMRDATLERSLVMAKRIAQHEDAPVDVLDRIAARWGKTLRHLLLQHKHLSDQARITISLV